MKKILAPTDFSQNSLASLKYAAELARINNSKLYILHISYIPTYYINNFENYPLYRNDLQNAIERIKKVSRSKINELLKYSYMKSLDLITEVKLGYSIYFEIINYAKKIKPDIIIMGSKSGKKGSLFNIGSNTERVIRTTEIPVLVVKKQVLPKKTRKIVFASDFEKDAKKIFSVVHSLININKPEIHLLYINTKSNYHEFEDIKLRMLRFKKLFPGNFKMLIRAYKDVDDGIVKYANSINADLIALGVKRRKRISLYLTDRITEGTISKSKIPVLAIDNPK